VLKQIEYVGKKVSYTVAGQGKPLMLIHGFAEDAWIWRFQLEALQEKFQLILPDLPGSGGSEFNPTLTTMDDYAACIKFVLDAEEIQQCILVGHSMGGYIALGFAEKYPNRVRGLGLFHSTAFADSVQRIEARRKSIEFILHHGPQAFLDQSIPNLFSEKFSSDCKELLEDVINHYHYFLAATLINYYEAMIERPDRTDVLKNIFSRPLFILGEKDKIIPLEDGLRQTHMPQSSQVYILENAAHMGMLEEAAKSAAILEEFVLGI
jgi:pimeloyl-ACP methyl ester carboxylesterase